MSNQHRHLDLQGALDPTIDRQDGSQAIEVTALFEETVVAVRHLGAPTSARARLGTYLLLANGWTAFAVGLLLTLTGRAGAGTLLLTAGLGLGIYGVLRLLEQRRSPHFVLGGGERADLNIAHATLPAGGFPLVRSEAHGHKLRFTAAMGGSVFFGAEQSTPAELIASGRATPTGAPGCYELTIPPDARVALEIGEHTFLVNSVTPARRVAGPLLGRVNWSAQLATGASFVAHVVILAAVFAIPPDAKALSLEMFNTDNKFVEYLVKPKVMQDEMSLRPRGDKGTKQGSGKPAAAHKGQEGKSGSPKARKRGGRLAIKGNRDEVQLARKLARQVQGAGILGTLKGSRGGLVASIFSRHDSAIGRDAEDALGSIIGDVPGEDYGTHGLGLTGPGRGGGGPGHLIGTGRLPTIGGNRVGGPGGRTGRGTRIGLPPRKPRVPRVVILDAIKRGALSKAIIRRVVRRHRNEVRYCYQKELTGNKRLSGRIVVGFTIGGNGRVVLSRLKSSTLGNRAVERCVVKAVRRWAFPKPANGGIVIVSYPFMFKTAGK